MLGCDDPPTFFSYTEPVAQKAHRCCECSAPIRKGEKHFCGRGKWQDSLETYRQHFLCMEACMLIRDEFGGDCIGFGMLKEEFDELRCDNWYQQRDRYKSAWQRLRKMMADIKRRERAGDTP